MGIRLDGGGAHRLIITPVNPIVLTLAALTGPGNGGAAVWVDPDTPEGWAHAVLETPPARRGELITLGYQRLARFSHDAAAFRQVLDPFLDRACAAPRERDKLHPGPALL